MMLLRSNNCRDLRISSISLFEHPADFVKFLLASYWPYKLQDIAAIDGAPSWGGMRDIYTHYYRRT